MFTIIEKCNQQILSRDLSVPFGWDNFKKRVLDHREDKYLIKGEGFSRYSNREVWHRSACYLYGIDDGQEFAVRVPSTAKTVKEAISFLTPYPIKEAQRKGKTVKRQGDIFFTTMRISGHDMSALSGTRHQARERAGGGLTCVHPEHKPVILSGKHKWRAYVSKQVHGVPGD